MMENIDGISHVTALKPNEGLCAAFILCSPMMQVKGLPQFLFQRLFHRVADLLVRLNIRIKFLNFHLITFISLLLTVLLWENLSNSRLWGFIPYTNLKTIFFEEEALDVYINSSLQQCSESQTQNEWKLSFTVCSLNNKPYLRYLGQVKINGRMTWKKFFYLDFWLCQ